MGLACPAQAPGSALAPETDTLSTHVENQEDQKFTVILEHLSLGPAWAT